HGVWRVVERLQVRHLGDAWLAPRRPEAEDDRFAFARILRERDGVAVDVVEREVGDVGRAARGFASAAAGRRRSARACATATAAAARDEHARDRDRREDGAHRRYSSGFVSTGTASPSSMLQPSGFGSWFFRRMPCHGEPESLVTSLPYSPL